MRLQLALVAVGLSAATPPAHADGTLSMRGVYYKERATRVVQPMLDGVFDAGTDGIVTAHFLVDAITSASSSSGAENATPFTENRYEAGGGYTHELSDLRLGGEAKYSTESDYTSIFAGLRGEMDLARKNAVLGLGVGVSHDTISAGAAQGLNTPMIECTPGDAQTECPLTTLAVFASASQILSKNSLVAITYDLSRLRGYQSNPYRMALALDGTAPERHPTERLRQAVAASFRYYVPSTQTTLIAAYRFYRDNWKINAHTPELRIIQQVGLAADASVRYRYHSQDAAFFYEDRYSTTDISVNRYLSDDVKLSSFTGHTFEAKLGILGETFGMSGRWAGARFEGILEYVVQHNRFGNAIIAHVALTVPFEY
jgi:hypothetical protein